MSNPTDKAADELFSALIQQESGGRHYGDNGELLESSAGAQGITQVMPATGQDPGFGVAPLKDNSEAEYKRFGRDYLRAMSKRYNGDKEAMLIAYNAGPGNADKFIASGRDYGVLPVREETEPYVRNILNNAPKPEEIKEAVSPDTESGNAAMSNQEFFSNLISGVDDSTGNDVGVMTGLKTMEGVADYFDNQALNAEQAVGDLPDQLAPEYTPTGLNEIFGRGVQAGSSNLRADMARSNAALQTILGNQEAADNALALADQLGNYSARELKNLEEFGEFLENPTVEGFFTQAAATLGQATPSLIATVGSSFAGGFTGVLAGAAGKAGLRQAGVVTTRRLGQDILKKKARGEALDADEELLLREAYSYTRAATQGLQRGMLGGAFASEYSMLSGAAVSEFVETDGDLSRDDAVASFMVGAPLAAVGVAGEAVIAKAFINAARKRAAGKSGSIWMDYAKAVAKGTGQGALVEGATEGAQEGALAGLRSTIDDQYTAEQASLRIAQGIFGGFLAGGLVGGGGRAVASPIGILRDRLAQAPTDPDSTDGGETRRSAVESLQRAGQYAIASLVTGAQKAAELIDQKYFSSQEALLQRDTLGLNDETLSRPTVQSENDLNSEYVDMLNPDNPRQGVWLGESYAAGLNIEKSEQNQVIEASVDTETGIPLFAAWIPGQGVALSPDRARLQSLIDEKASETALRDFIGFHSTKPMDADRVVRVIDKETGGVVIEEGTNAELEPEVIAHHSQRSPERYETDVVDLETALEQRKDRVDREAYEMSQELKEVAGADEEVTMGDVLDNKMKTVDLNDAQRREEVQRYTVSDFQLNDKYDEKEEGTRNELMSNIRNLLTDDEFTPIAELEGNNVLSTAALRGILKIAESLVETVGGENISFIPRVEMNQEGNAVVVSREPVAIKANEALMQAELEKLRKTLAKEARIPDPRYETSVLRFVHRRKGDSNREVGPNFSRMINIGVRMNWLDGSSLVGDRPLTFLQQRKLGMIRMAAEMKIEGYDFSFKTAHDKFETLTFSPRDWKKLPSLRSQFLWEGYREGVKINYSYGQLVSAKDPMTKPEWHLDFASTDGVKTDVQEVNPERRPGTRKVDGKKVRVDRDFSKENQGQLESDPEEQAKAELLKKEEGAGRASRKDLVTPAQKERAKRAKATEKRGRGGTRNTDDLFDAYAADDGVYPSRTVTEGFTTEREVEQKAIRGNKSGVVKPQPPGRTPTRRYFGEVGRATKRMLDVTREFLVSRPAIDVVMASEYKKNKDKFVNPTEADTKLERMKLPGERVIGTIMQGTNGGLVIMLNDVNLGDRSADGMDMMHAMVISHEIGHIVYNEQIQRLQDKDPDTYSTLWEEYKKAMLKKGDDVSQYTNDQFGFTEWFADQVAAHAYQKTTDGKTGRTKGNNSFSQKMNEKLNDLIRTMKKYFKVVNDMFKGRFEQNLEFATWMDNMLDGIKKQRSEMKAAEKKSALREAKQREPITEAVVEETIYDEGTNDAYDSYMMDLYEKGTSHDFISQLDTAQNRARAKRLKTMVNRLMSGSSTRWLKRHLYAADDWFRSLGDSGTEMAKLFYGRSQSGEKIGFHEAKSQAHNKLVSRLADALDLPDNFNEDMLHEGDIADAFEAAADETVDTANLTGKARKVREFYEWVFDNYLKNPAGGMWLPIKRRKNYAPRTMNTPVIRDNQEGFIEFLQQYMSADAAQGVVDSIFGGDMENDPVGYPSFGSGKGRKLEAVPTKALIDGGWVLPPAQSSLLYLHQISKRVEYNRLGMKKKLKNLSKQIIAENPDYPEIGRRVQQAIMGQFGRLDTFRGKHIEDSSFMKRTNEIGSTHTIITTLSFAVFASFPDLGGIATRAKEVSGLGTVINQIFNSTDRAESMALARAVGIATHDSLSNTFMSSTEMDHTGDMAQKINRAFFRWTGTEAYTSMMRRIATGVGKEFLIHNATREDFDSDPRRKRYLDELGVSRQDVLDWHNDRHADGTLKLEGAKFDKVAPAIARFANEAIIRPNAAQRPVWASNPWFMLLWHLKSYFYAYGKTVVGGLGREIKNRFGEAGAFAGAAPIIILAAGLMLPLTMIGLAFREWAKWFGKWLLPGVEADGFTFQSRYMSTPEYTMDIVDRSGILGPFTLMRSTYEGFERDGVPFGAVIANVPAVDAIDDSLFDGDAARLIPIVNNVV